MRHSILLLTGVATSTLLHAQRILPIGSGVAGIGIATMAEYNGQLIVGGVFANFNDHARRNLQGWDGTQHFDLPGAFEDAPERVSAITLFQGDLIAAGRETGLGNIARWDGSTWSAMGTGLPQRVSALCIHNDELYAGGLDSSVSRWTGTDWEQVGLSFNAPVRALASYGGRLIAGGDFTADANGNIELLYLVAWSGTEWEPLATGLTTGGPVKALLSAGDELYIGGSFITDASAELDLPGWTVFDGTSFSEESIDTLATDGVVGICALPDGRIILGGGGNHSVILDGNDHQVLRFGKVKAAAEYTGRTYVAGESGTQSWAPVNRIGELVNGLDYAELSVNNIRPSVTPTPALFNDPWLGGPGYETDSTSGRHTICSASPWVTGYSDGVLHSSAPQYAWSTVEGSWPWAGPTADVMDADFYSRWYQVWKVSADEIAQHIQFWDDPGYEMPYAIATWPGNGNLDNGEPALIAPFADLDDDGLYEPASGEYPIILGDQAIWYILHSVPDTDGLHPGMALDVHVMHRGIQEPLETDIFNTVFTNYQVINRSPDTYTDVRFAEFMDFDIGGGCDDRIGCDSTLNLYYGYNGDDYDDGCNGALGFGNALKAQGVMYLNQVLTAHRDMPTGITVPLDDLMNGTQNGQPFTEPGYPTHFQHLGGSWWQGGPPDNQRAVGSIGPFTLLPGDTICVDMAHITAPAMDGLDTLLAYAANVQATYPLWNAPCFADFSTGVEPGEMSEVLSVFPNPASSVITVARETDGMDARIELRDLCGRLMMIQNWPAGTPSVQVDVNFLAAGMYVLASVTTEGKRQQQSLVIQ